jgi:hypothetical protein
MRERRLAEAGWPVEEKVVDGLLALLGRVDCDAKVVLQLLLPDELFQASWAQRKIDRLVFVLRRAGDDALSGRTGLLRMLVLLGDIIVGRERPVYAGLDNAHNHRYASS